ncbi:GAF domain-containing sensor histidine kinase [Cyanobacteria bacterium FACHB-471]|nr:GAF domain-containing sensor histidine kinase [Cyanobacteria bacterium FACHB-471]
MSQNASESSVQSSEEATPYRFEQLAKANAVLKKTLDILASEPELDTALGHVLRVMTECLGSPSAALWLVTPDSDAFHVHLAYYKGEVFEATPDGKQLPGPWPQGHDLTWKTHICDRHPTIYDVETAPELTPRQRQFMQHLGAKTLLGVPLLLRNEIIGSFTLRFMERREFQADDLELMQALAHYATLAIQLLRMAERDREAAILEERNRLAREIHDTLAQAFTGISIQLGVAKWLLQRDPTAVAEIIARVESLTQSGLAEAQRSVWALRPHDKEYADLAQQLASSVEQIGTGSPIQIDLQIVGTPRLLSPIIGKNMLRISQEAMTNTLKHAQATTLRIKLTYEEAIAELCVQDNGRGFLPDVDTGGFGLISMSERADRIAGQLTIHSQPGQGTEICIQVAVN